MAAILGRLAAPQLSVQSPFLDWSNLLPQENGISDADYEQLPSQLLFRLGLASQGALVSVNGQWTAQFTGAAGHVYVLQSSFDLVNWINVYTNSPVNGQVNFAIAPAPVGTAQFYRSQLLP
jgi:hypothetical protein